MFLIVSYRKKGVKRVTKRQENFISRSEKIKIYGHEEKRNCQNGLILRPENGTARCSIKENKI